MSVPQVTSLLLERYCPDRSAEYEWRVTRAGGGTVFKLCFLHGAPELAPERCPRSSSFHPQPPAGVMAMYPRHGWSFIRIPGRDLFFFASERMEYLEKSLFIPHWGNWHNYTNKFLLQNIKIILIKRNEVI